MWLSLVERYVRDVEAAGSNPVTPTQCFQGFPVLEALVFYFISTFLNGFESHGLNYQFNDFMENGNYNIIGFVICYEGYSKEDLSHGF